MRSDSLPTKAAAVGEVAEVGGKAKAAAKARDNHHRKDNLRKGNLRKDNRPSRRRRMRRMVLRRPANLAALRRASRHRRINRARGRGRRRPHRRPLDPRAGMAMKMVWRIISASPGK